LKQGLQAEQTSKRELRSGQSHSLAHVQVVGRLLERAQERQHFNGIISIEFSFHGVAKGFHGRTEAFRHAVVMLLVGIREAVRTIRYQHSEIRPSGD
jgi:hypothetical protein